MTMVASHPLVAWVPPVSRAMARSNSRLSWLRWSSESRLRRWSWRVRAARTALIWGVGPVSWTLACRWACPGPDAACCVGVVLAALGGGEVDLQDELAELLGQLVGGLAVVAGEHDRDGGLSVLQGQAQLGVADGADDGS